VKFKPEVKLSKEVLAELSEEMGPGGPKRVQADQALRTRSLGDAIIGQYFLWQLSEL
jgi:hypothetical protein